MLSREKDSFTSFLDWMPFISFPCLIVLVRTSNTVLNRSGEGRHPYLVPVLGEKHFKVFHNYDFFYILKMFLLLRVLQSFRRCSL